MECSTKIDQMNYCIECLLASQTDSTKPQVQPAREWLVGVPLMILSFGLTAGVFMFFGLLLAYLRGSGMGN